ncbi:MAG: tRNA uracil 4-sulfurtransferase ThiI [Vicinamibacterales bacterium]
MQPQVIIVHFSEIALKLGQRPMFVARLLENVRRCLEGLDAGAVRHQWSRLFIEVGGSDVERVLQRLSVIPGIANCFPACRIGESLEDLDRAVEEALDAGWKPVGTFAVQVKRVDRKFATFSPEIGRRVGAMIAERTGAPVDLTSPDTAVHVHVIPGEILLSFDRVEGCGGLPASTSGRLLLLLSGGIDSPVAGLRMQRRGARVEALHFHSVPYLSAASQHKARQLAAVIARGQQRVRLTMVPFGDCQAEIVRFVPRPLRVVLYRRMMMRIASLIARRTHCLALITGESLGQVASQTLRNMNLIERASTFPLLRPLVGSDKLEISRYADRAGTYEISIQPDQDCCTLFVPKHPATAAKEPEVLEAESLLDVEELVRRCVDASTEEWVDPSWPEPSQERMRVSLV